ALGVGGGRVSDLPAVSGPGVAPVQGAALPAQLTEMGALADAAPGGAGDRGDRSRAQRRHDALRRTEAASALTLSGRPWQRNLLIVSAFLLERRRSPHAAVTG